MRILFLLTITGYFLPNSESAKILCIFLIPLKSHKLAFLPLTQELLKRGHKIVSVTVNPVFSEGITPENMTEINIQDISYETRFHEFQKHKKDARESNTYSKLILAYTVMETVFIAQCKSDPIQKFINDKTNKFDLIIYDGFSYQSILFSHIFKVPVIPINSAILTTNYINILGITGHTQYYVNFFRQTVKNNLSPWETCVGLYEHFSLLIFLEHNEKRFEDIFKKTLAPTSPPISELYNNIHIHLVNVNTIWDSVLPMSSNVFNLGHMQNKTHEVLPKDIQTYLDSSKNGVIYISFGTNIVFSTSPPKVISGFINIISQLPYDVLWKWDEDEMPNKPENIRIVKWLPQADVLKHPKIKLFITQAGIHSTDEAIHAGVPLIGIPFALDQVINAENYVHHGIGKKLDIKTITPEKFKDAIEAVIGNESTTTLNDYHTTTENMRNLLEDKPLTSMERAIWAIEYVLRHGGAHHMRSPASNLSWAEYFEFELLSMIATIFIAIFCCLLKLLLVLKKLLTIF